MQLLEASETEDKKKYMFEADLHCMRRAKVLTLGNSLLSLCSETTTELPKSTNVTFRVLIYKGLLGDVQG